MLMPLKLEELDDYFIDFGARRSKGVYFCRLNGYNAKIHAFIQRYYEAARLCGVIIEGRLQNPDNRNLAYYNEIMGMEFRMDPGFINTGLKRWLPRINDAQRKNIADSIYSTLRGLKETGKNENMLKNAYVKFMCWLYYRFERILNHLGEEKLPKILFEGSISYHGLLLMSVLSGAGCDIVLLQYQGDDEYRRIDPDSIWSMDYRMPGMTAFPPAFSLKQIRADIREAQQTERLYGTKPQLLNCTNAWISGKPFEDIRRDIGSRGSDPHLFYNCFCRIVGAEDKLTYQNELYQFQMDLRNNKRRVVIVNNTISPPSMDEIQAIHRKTYQDIRQLIADLSLNLRSLAERELRSLAQRAFVDLMLEESKKAGENLSRLTNRAVYLLCWMKRYQQQLFGGWKSPEIACFFHMGGCKNANEVLFCRFLARMPVDVLILNPNLNERCCLADTLLYEVNYPNSLEVDRFPEETNGIRFSTAAYQAERELDTILYQDTGLYRNQQYTQANTVSLQTMYEEISILWDQELKYRPNFSTVDGVVNMPVLFSKICGVKDGDVMAYWRSIKKLITTDTLVISRIPGIASTAPNPLKPFATRFFRGGRVLKEQIRSHKSYQYGILREPIQEYLLDKIQLLLDRKIIKGTFENGTEYTIISTVLNLDRNTLRMIQKLDFTKKNPKLIYILTGEKVLSLEDTIYMAFLNLVGFDIALFVPTGYQCVEQYLNEVIFEEHQIGDYLYDLQVPDFDTISTSSRLTWRERIFKRGT